MKITKVARNRGAEISGMILNRVHKGNSQISLGEVQESVGVPVVAKIMENRKVNLSLYHRIPMPLFSRKSQFSKEVGKLAAAMIGIKEKKKGWFSRPGKEDVNREMLRESFYSSIFEN